MSFGFGFGLDPQPPRRHSPEALVGMAQSAAHPPTPLVAMRRVGWLVITPTSAGLPIGIAWLGGSGGWVSPAARWPATKPLSYTPKRKPQPQP